ncbi:MAG: gliding motility lipoprotein GldH [Bacteroidota bacterium]
MQRQSVISQGVLILILGIITLSCDSKRIYDEYRPVENQWHKDSIIAFKMTPPDTIKPYNLFINIRNNDAYKYSNLFLIAELNYPNGKIVKDTLEYKTAAPNGELLGKGFSDVKESKLWYKGFKSDFIFSESGEYTVNIQHAMRKNGAVNGIVNLEGVTDIGFRVEQK